MPFLAVFRWVIPAIFGEGTPPTFADWRPSFVFRTLPNNFLRWDWNEPAEWGDGGSGSRLYQVQFRVGSSPTTLGNWTTIAPDAANGYPLTGDAPRVRHVSQVGGWVDIRVRARNGAGIFTNWYAANPTQIPAHTRQFSGAFGSAFR